MKVEVRKGLLGKDVWLYIRKLENASIPALNLVYLWGCIRKLPTNGDER